MRSATIDTAADTATHLLTNSHKIKATARLFACMREEGATKNPGPSQLAGCASQNQSGHQNQTSASPSSHNLDSSTCKAHKHSHTTTPHTPHSIPSFLPTPLTSPFLRRIVFARFPSSSVNRHLYNSARRARWTRLSPTPRLALPQTTRWRSTRRMLLQTPRNHPWCRVSAHSSSPRAALLCRAAELTAVPAM
jgi:hypothetical protein